MELKNKLSNILKEYNREDLPFYEFSYKNLLHIDLVDGYPYIGDNLNLAYIEKACDFVEEIFDYMNYKNLLVIYDESNIEHKKEKALVEDSLKGISSSESYKLKDSENNIIYRYLYKVSEIDKKLFRDIILSDIGAEYSLASKISIIDLDRFAIFHLYDDRGLFIFEIDEEKLLKVWKKYKDRTFKNSNKFSIDSMREYWLDDFYEEYDLCLHGDLTIEIANNKIKNKDVTISAAALNMLKTLDYNHSIKDYNQLIPCCGFDMCANDKLDKVDILTCNKGMDFSIHHKDGMVFIKRENGDCFEIYYLQYKEEVLKFADKVEKKYESSKEKILPENLDEKNAYIAFWNEWHSIREKYKRIGEIKNGTII